MFVTVPEVYDPLVTAMTKFAEGKLRLDVVRELKNDRMVDTFNENPASFVESRAGTMFNV